MLEAGIVQAITYPSRFRIDIMIGFVFYGGVLLFMQLR